MFISEWFQRRTATTVNPDMTDETLQELEKAHRSLQRRERRIAFLRNRLSDERRVHASRQKATQDMLIMQQRPGQSLEAVTESHDIARLRGDLNTAFEMLDNFEAEARQNRDALARSEELEAENAAQRQIIAMLEVEIQAWQGSTAVAA